MGNNFLNTTLELFIIALILRNCRNEWSHISKCPCQVSDLSVKTSLIICVISKDQDKVSPFICSHEFVPFLNLTFLQEYNSLEDIDYYKCSVIINISNRESKSFNCPGKCHPVPQIEFSLNDLHLIKTGAVERFLCSLSTRSLIKHFKSIYANNSDLNTEECTLKYHLTVVAVRRLMECNETFAHIFGSIDTRSRLNFQERIHGLALWVGSTGRQKVGFAQQSILRGLPQWGPEGWIGWNADEMSYPCTNGSTLCKSANIQGIYEEGMPQTELADPRCDLGWACAQRRPIRALAHLLLLFDPQFVFLGDDDTYFNINLLQSNINHQLLADMSREPIVLGNFLLPKRKPGVPAGTVSRQGFYFGGAGYLLGRPAIQRLVARELFVYSDSSGGGSGGGVGSGARRRSGSNIRSGPQQRNNNNNNHDYESLLSLYRLAKTTSDLFCLPDSCILHRGVAPSVSSSRQGGITVPIGSRLVDLCMNLLSGEGTCHHSDHALSRCLFYGFRSIPRGLPCNASMTGPEKETYKNGPFMCGHISACNLSTHLTCHRWRPTSAEDLTPVRTYLTSSNTTEYTGCVAGKYDSH